jgi:hypothetical protein
MKKIFSSKNVLIFKSQAVKTVLSALAVAVFGFVLLNITFLFDFLLNELMTKFLGLFLKFNPEMPLKWFPTMMHVLFIIIIGLISWPVFRSKLGVIYKAIYMTVPTAVFFVTIGILLYNWPLAVYSICILSAVGILYFFYRTRQHWLYYYSVILVGLALVIFNLLGGEI